MTFAQMLARLHKQEREWLRNISNSDLAGGPHNCAVNVLRGIRIAIRIVKEYEKLNKNQKRSHAYAGPAEAQ